MVLRAAPAIREALEALAYVLALTIEPAGTGLAFAASLAAALVVQAASFMAVVRGRMAPLRAR